MRAPLPAVFVLLGEMNVGAWSAEHPKSMGCSAFVYAGLSSTASRWFVLRPGPFLWGLGAKMNVIGGPGHGKQMPGFAGDDGSRRADSGQVQKSLAKSGGRDIIPLFGKGCLAGLRVRTGTGLVRGVIWYGVNNREGHRPVFG